jgi:lipoprotein-anchoring transpeptidase ErfK/SrfK
VAFSGAPGEIVIDTRARKLYFAIDDKAAYAYPISVGRDGFKWSGTETISRVATWPDWHPPHEMRKRDPSLPVRMTGGVRNPLGAVALYLGDTLYRIHGTNDRKSIGRASSSGCFRMLNEHAAHLAQLAGAGTVVRVLPHLPADMPATDHDAAEPEAARSEAAIDPAAVDPQS